MPRAQAGSWLKCAASPRGSCDFLWPFGPVSLKPIDGTSRLSELDKPVLVLIVKNGRH